MYNKYILIFFNRKMFFIISLKEFVSYSCNHNNNLYNKFKFLENYCIFLNYIKIMLEFLKI